MTDTYVRPSVGAHARTLDARWYTSPDVFADERKRIFERDWICVGHESRIEQPGEYFVATVAGESFIIVRDGSLVVHALYNVCRHRGTRLCEQPQGHLVGSIQCPYHAWTYALDGALLAARNMQGVAGFDRADYPLHRAALTVEGGFIFVSLSRETTPLGEPLAPLAAEAGALGHRPLARSAAHRLRRAVQLEARLSELFRMLSLPRDSSAIGQAVSVRQRPQRFRAPVRSSAAIPKCARREQASRRPACAAGTRSVRWTAPTSTAPTTTRSSHRCC